jgi:hypothetical protein
MNKITSILLLFSVISLNFKTLAQTNNCAYSGTSITVGTDCSSPSNFNSTNNSDYWDGFSGCSSSDNDDAWWWFTATGTSTTITYNSTSDAVMHLFTGACATNMSALACVDNNSSGEETITYATTIGTDYSIRIQQYNSDANMNGTICVYSPVSGGNDACSNAISVLCGNTYTGTTVGASDSGETALSACGTSPSAAGVWYVFTGDGSTVTASLCSGTSYDSKINVYSSPSNCAGINTCVASNDDGCGSASTVTFATIVGRNYYILVNGYSGATGSFSLALTCCTPGIPACPTLNSPANAATGVAQCSSLTWTAPSTSGCSSVDSYDVYFGTTNPPAFLANTTSTSYPITTSPSTVYYWQIRSKNSSGASAACSVRSFTAAATGNPQYTTVDDANSASPYDCVNLTSTTNDQRGCAWDLNSTLNFTSNFSYDFTVNLGNSDGGGDGMAFVMQNDPQGRCKCGTTGEALGAGGISNSVIVEIDTYLNTNDRDDFSSSFIGCGGSEEPDHIDIWYNGSINPDLDSDCDAMGIGERPAVSSAVRLRNAGANYNIENGNNHVLRIDWTSATNTLTAKVLNTALTVTYGTIATTFNPMTVFGTNTPYFGFTASTGGLNNAQTFCNPTSLLPIQLMSFNSYCYENFRKIYWSTASENNNHYFTIEKSFDGINFHFFQQVAASGEKSLGAEYEIVDNDLTSKIVYYRLSQTDYNGVSKTFDIISSECKIENNTFSIEKIFENKEEFILQIHATEGENHDVNIYDISGQLIFENKLLLEKGLNEINIAKKHLSSGMYFFQLKNSKAQITKKYFVLE